MRLHYLLSILILLAACNSSTDTKRSTKSPETIKETKIAEIQRDTLPGKDAADLFVIWQNVMRGLEKRDLKFLKKYSFDSIQCQACKAYPKGTNINDIPTQQIHLSEFLAFYTDSFLFPNVPHFITQGNLQTEHTIGKMKNPGGLSQIHEDSIVFYNIRFQEFDKYSLDYRFTKLNGKFRFFGLYY